MIKGVGGGGGGIWGKRFFFALLPQTKKAQPVPPQTLEGEVMLEQDHDVDDDDGYKGVQSWSMPVPLGRD